MSKSLFEKDIEDHHKSKYHEEEMSVQKPSKIDQVRFEDVGL